MLERAARLKIHISSLSRDEAEKATLTVLPPLIMLLVESEQALSVDEFQGVCQYRLFLSSREFSLSNTDRYFSDRTTIINDDDIIHLHSHEVPRRRSRSTYKYRRSLYILHTLHAPGVNSLAEYIKFLHDACLALFLCGMTFSRLNIFLRDITSFDSLKVI